MDCQLTNKIPVESCSVQSNEDLLRLGPSSASMMGEAEIRPINNATISIRYSLKDRWNSQYIKIHIMTSRFLPHIIRATGRQFPLARFPTCRNFVSATLPVLEKKTVKVPTMGDSITEVRV